MFRRNWRAIVASVLAILFFGALGIVAYHFYNAAEQRNADYDYQPAAKPSGGVTGLPKTPAKPYQPDCQNPQKYEAADLCAQWAAVEQVSEANRLSSVNARMAVASLVATAIATFLLLWTLWETRETSRRELRAYLYVDGGGIFIGRRVHNKGKVIAVSRVINSGSTPAHAAIHWMDIGFGDETVEDEMSAPSNLQNLSYTTVPANGGISLDRVLPDKLTREQIEQIKTGKSAIYVYGAIEYIDVFDRKRRTDYRLFYSGQWPIPKDALLRFCNRGNEAT